MTETETATLAAGCFWGVEHTLAQLPGILSTRVGYTGGRREHPSYEQVCSEATGHAEAVEVVFDPAQTSFEAILDAFWALHDPTTLNRQGPDNGSQYRSAIFVHGPEQRAMAEASKTKAQARFQQPIVTEITDAQAFWPAEDYHQQYVAKKGLGAACGLH